MKDDEDADAPLQEAIRKFFQNKEKNQQQKKGPNQPRRRGRSRDRSYNDRGRERSRSRDRDRDDRRRGDSRDGWRPSGGYGGGGYKRRDPEKVTCYTCNETGHYSRECPNNNKKDTKDYK